MTLPDLSNWDATKTALHQSLQALRSTRLLGVDPMPSDLHYGTLPTPSGATTGPLRFGGELRLDYVRAAAVYERDGAEVFAVGLDCYNQTSFFDAVFAAFKAAGHNLQPNHDKVTETTAFNFDKGQASTYAALQWRMYSVLSRLKGRMYGPQTPIALWPHGFDLSTIWFADGMDEHQDPQINFGFSPGTPDVGQPYFYFYAWPVPDGLSERMPSIVTWNSNWSTPGGVIRYDQFAGADDPDGLVLDTLTQVYNTASAMVRANAAAD
jgi:hypothetical protein